MQIVIPTSHGFSLSISNDPDSASSYPTARLMKGFMLNRGGGNLAEESVGFGLPLLKRGGQTYFPGSLELTLVREGSPWEVRAVYAMDLVERIGRRDGSVVMSGWLYGVKNNLAALFRQVPFLRGFLSILSTCLRRWFGWQTRYEKSEFAASVPVSFVYDDQKGALEIRADLSRLNEGDEAIMMNEMGALAFDQYRDSNGAALSGEAIGAWDEVTAAEAGFASPANGIDFRVQQVPGARLYRGRELSDGRLAWSGFGYSITPARGTFSCSVKVGMRL